MNKGTAKPSPSEMQGIKHHFVNTLSVEQDHNAGKFERESLELLDVLFQKKNPVVVVGGSGLYVNALCDGMDEMPTIPDGLRERITREYEEFGLAHIQEKIAQLDPLFESYLDIKNPQRVIRAIEVSEATGVPYSHFRIRQKADRPFNSIKIGIERPREELYNRINKRMDLMIEEGLFEEAESLIKFKQLNALQTVGYSEIFPYFDEEYDKEEAIRLLKRNSRRYAKRQLTWFKKDRDTKWFHPEDSEEIKKYIISKANE